MNFRSKGKAFILSHENYEDRKDGTPGRRDGNQVDVENLKKTYEQLGLDVIVCKDQTTKEIKDKLKGMSIINNKSLYL